MNCRDPPDCSRRMPMRPPNLRGYRRSTRWRSEWPAFRNRPTVTISHEPWGEATINFPWTDYLIKALRARTLEILNPRIGSRTIRFLTPDVALVDGAWTYKDDGATTRTTLLLFVMKKERGNWKIASIRVLAPAP